MALEKVEREIDGVTFIYQPMMATPARELLDKLAQRFGPVIASFVEGLDKADGLSLEGDNMGEVLGMVTRPMGMGLHQLFGAIDPKFHRELSDKLAQQTCTRDDGGNEPKLSKEVREIMFGQGLMLEMKWIGFCLEVQYADFLAPLRDLSLRTVALRAMANTSSASPSQSQSTGTSTESPQAGDTK